MTAGERRARRRLAERRGGVRSVSPLPAARLAAVVTAYSRVPADTARYALSRMEKPGEHQR